MMHHAVTAGADAPRSRVVLLQHGGRSHGHLPAPGVDLEVALLAQAPEEPASEFALSALRLIARLEGSGRIVPTATLVVDPSNGPRALAARRWVAGAVLEHFQLRGWGELVLSAADGADIELRVALFELAEALLGELDGELISIRVRFGDAPPFVPSLEARRAAGADGTLISGAFA